MSEQVANNAAVKYVHSSTVMASEVGEQELVMMDADLATYFGLMSTGPAIWERFAAPTTVDDAVAHLEATYQAPAGSIRADVEQLVEELVERRLLVAENASDSAETLPGPQ